MRANATGEPKPGTLSIETSNHARIEFEGLDQPTALEKVLTKITEVLQNLCAEPDSAPGFLEFEISAGFCSIRVKTQKAIAAEYTRYMGPDPPTEPKLIEGAEFQEFIQIARDWMKAQIAAPYAAPYAVPYPTPGDQAIDFLPPDPRKFAHAFEPKIGDELTAGESPLTCRNCGGGSKHVIHQVDAAIVQ